jgi:hypothetical protein
MFLPLKKQHNREIHYDQTPANIQTYIWGQEANLNRSIENTRIEYIDTRKIYMKFQIQISVYR